MYPNPANDELYVLLAAPVSPEQARIELYNVLGERIMAQQAQNGQNRVDMAGRPSGIYFVKVMNGGMLTGTRKIIKQ